MTVLVLLLADDDISNLRCLKVNSDEYLAGGCKFVNNMDIKDEVMASQAIVAFPSEWPLLKAKKLLTVDLGQENQRVFLPDALPCAYGCCRMTCFVIRIDSHSHVCVSGIVDGEHISSQIATDIHTSLPASIKDVLHSIDAVEKRPVLFENVIVWGSGWTVDLQNEIVTTLEAVFKCASTFPGDYQAKSVTLQTVPAYHTMIEDRESLTKQLPLFGMAIAQRSILQELLPVNGQPSTTPNPIGTRRNQQ